MAVPVIVSPAFTVFDAGKLTVGLFPEPPGLPDGIGEEDGVGVV